MKKLIIIFIITLFLLIKCSNSELLVPNDLADFLIENNRKLTAEADSIRDYYKKIRIERVFNDRIIKIVNPELWKINQQLKRKYPGFITEIKSNGNTVNKEKPKISNLNDYKKIEETLRIMEKENFLNQIELGLWLLDEAIYDLQAEIIFLNENLNHYNFYDYYVVPYWDNYYLYDY